MKFPYFKKWDTTPVTVEITDGITEYGEDNVVFLYGGLCRYSEKLKTIRTADGQLITLNGVLTIGQDIAPHIPCLSGRVTVNNKTWNIYSGSRPRNPDGTVSYTRLELM
jgi:hypothetical protein